MKKILLVAMCSLLSGALYAQENPFYSTKTAKEVSWGGIMEVPMDQLDASLKLKRVGISGFGNQDYYVYFEKSRAKPIQWATGSTDCIVTQKMQKLGDNHYVFHDRIKDISISFETAPASDYLYPSKPDINKWAKNSPLLTIRYPNCSANGCSEVELKARKENNTARIMLAVQDNPPVQAVYPLTNMLALQQTPACLE